MEQSALLDSVLSDVALMAQVVRKAPDAPIQHCPGWTVEDLVRHHGDILQWARRIVETGESDEEDEDSGPSELDEVIEWYERAASEFVGVASATDPSRVCWTFGFPPAQAWFWTRRQALEAAVHRWDAQLAAGSVDPIPAPVCRAGIAEVAELFFPRQLSLDRTPPLSAPVGVHATDVNGAWILGAEGTGPPMAEVRGPSEVVLLLLWRRTDLDDPRLTVSGSDALIGEMRNALWAP